MRLIRRRAASVKSLCSDVSRLPLKALQIVVSSLLLHDKVIYSVKNDTYIVN